MQHESRPRSRLLQSALLAVLQGAACATALADAADDASALRAPAGVGELEAVVVTGSNIRRSDLEAVVPVTVLDATAMEVRNALLPSELLTSLPFVVNLPENETRLGSSGARGDNANVNLRNMGATATLVLLNGRRLAINPFTAGLSQAVNVNHLPTFGIERVEVLRDGASSIYGSDAVGGVINYVMRRDFQGFETQLRYGLPENGGGESVQAGLAFGTSFADGRGRAFGTLEAVHREATRLTDRDFSSTAFNSDRAPPPWNNPGGVFDGRSTRGYWPTFRVGTATANNFFRPVNGTPALTTVAPNRTTNPEFFLDLNQFGYASPRTTRGNAFVNVEFDLTDAITAFGEFGYYASSSTMRRQPMSLNAPTSDLLMVMPVDSPYNPFGSRFFHPNGTPNADGSPRLVGTPRTVSFTQFTLRELGAETITTENDVYRIVGGLRGRVGATTWTWESSLFYNRVSGDDNAFPDIRESRLQAALARTDANALNPFGYTFRIANNAVVADQPYANPQSVIDSFSETYSRSARSYIASADLRTTGTLFAWWGGDVQAAFGAEYRREDLRDVRPPFHGENPPGSGLDPTNNDFLLHPPRPDVFGDRDVTSVYAELVVPLVEPSRGIPLVHSLEITGSARFEDYSDFGTTTKPKFGVNWRPISWLMLRGSYNEGFMAPSLAALYTSPRWTITAGAGDIDAYRNPFLNEGPYVMRTDFGGNPDLRAQESEGRTFGFVLDVPFVQGLSVTADYWRIDRTNLLGQRSVAQIDQSDRALLLAYTREQLAAGVPINQIDLGSGGPNYRGDPGVERFALTPEDRAAFAAWNAANPNNPAAPVGRIFRRDRPFVNLATSEHEGIDYALRWVLPRQNWGRVVVQSDWSNLRKSTSVLAPPNVAPVVNNELFAQGAAKWRGTTYLGWDHAAWSAGLGIFYIGKTHDAAATTTQAVYESLGRPSYIAPHFTGGQTVYRKVIDPITTYNLTMGYQLGNRAAWLGDARLRFAVTNLTDKAPPVAAGFDGFGYDPGVNQSLLAGRTWSVELATRF